MNGMQTYLNGAIGAASTPRAVRAGTVRRIAAFARPHRAELAALVLVTAVSAALLVGTPLLAGRVVDTIVRRGEVGTVVGLALAIAGLAIAGAALGLVERRLSAGIGEGLIHDLRRAVFEHVQRMPVAFFTRVRTGALVHRLNADVRDAQQAFTSTLSGLVTNVIQLAASLVVMWALSWQVTALALLLLPVFVLPVRRMGRRLASLQRETSALGAAMTTRMAERFSAPGATLVRLFGRPREEVEEFGGHAARVRDVAVRIAMLSKVFHAIQFERAG